MQYYVVRGFKIGAASAIPWVIGWRILRGDWEAAVILGAVSFAIGMIITIIRGVFATPRSPRNSN